MNWISVKDGVLPTARALAYTPTEDESMQYRVVPAGLSRVMLDATHFLILEPPSGLGREK